MEQTCKCGGTIESGKTLYEGLIVECLKCNKCGKVSFTPEQTQKIIELKDYGEEVESTRKIITVGHSVAITLPRKLRKIGAIAGRKVKVRLLDPNTITVEFLDVM